MTNDIGNYERHARFWDWGGNDRTNEYEYWLNFAAQYGKNILIPMCALGETGAYMAERGYTVTAFDTTPEMITEGKKRFGNISGLGLYEGDVRDFRFEIQPVDFCFCTDFGHIHDMNEIKQALVCINQHLRDNGCLVIEAGLRTPDDKSDYHPCETFYPFKQIYPDIKVWKTGETRNDAETGRCYISQTFYAENKDCLIESFVHAFYLQGYFHEEWISALTECGFKIKNEYRNREKNPWRGGDKYWIAEAVKSTSEKERYSPGIDLFHLQTPVYRHGNRKGDFKMKTVKEYWNEDSDTYFKNSNTEMRKLIADPAWAFPLPVMDMIRREFGDLKGKRVLVPSSGDNAAVFAFHLMGADVTSADISEKQLSNAKKIADTYGWNIPFVCDDSMELSKFGDNEFDLVYTSNGVHVWINDLRKMYENFYRVLKPAGKYIMFETHPFIRPMGNDGVPVLSVRKPYEQTDQSDDVQNFGWRIMDLFNAVIKSGFSVTHMEEFHPQKTDHNLWFYKTAKEAEADNYKKFDWKQNPWAVLPQWIGFSAIKN